MIFIEFSSLVAVSEFPVKSPITLPVNSLTFISAYTDPNFNSIFNEEEFQAQVKSSPVPPSNVIPALFNTAFVLFPLFNLILKSFISTVVLFTVVVVPETCKLPVITRVSPDDDPIIIFSFVSDPFTDSKFCNLCNKLAFETSSYV